jgi:hypothetical protein
MGRRNPRNSGAAVASAAPSATKPAIPGGAAGVPGVDETPAEREEQVAPERLRRAKRWMVVDGPRDGNGNIRFNDGYMSSIRLGKIVDESGSFNLRKMKEQGIRLEEMPEEEPAPMDLGGPNPNPDEPVQDAASIDGPSETEDDDEDTGDPPQEQATA